MKRKHQWMTLFLLFSLSLIISCAPTYQKAEINLVWPLPPDEPRIKYIDTIRSTADVGKKSSAVASALFGEESVERFAKPYGVAVDNEGRIYVTDIGRVFVFDLKNKDYSTLGETPGLGQLKVPIGIAAAADGRIFVTDVAQDRVYVYRSSRFEAAIGKTGELESPSGLGIDDQRKLLYAVDSRKHTINVYSLHDYSLLRTIGQRGTDEGGFNFPTNIALDRNGNIYVVDTGNFRIQVFDPNGKFVKAFGQAGDAPGSFARPKGIGVDSEGHIYIVDTAFANFQIFDKDWKILLFVGSSGGGPGKFRLPAGLTVDKDDKIYVVDQVPGSLQIFQYLGQKGK